MQPDLPPISALDAIYRRRATRAFTTELVDKSTIETLLRAAVHAPTAMHLEPWAFVVVQDRALLKRLSDRAKALALTPRGAEHRGLAGSPLLADPAYDIFHGAGTLVVICAKPMGSFVVADCWLAAQNLMIAALSLGLATCPIGFALPALADPEVKVELGIPPDVTAVAPIVVGVAAETPAPTSRRDPEILSWKK